MPYNVQSHIHLDFSVSVSGEYAPPQKWRVTTNTQVPMMYMNVRRSLRGKPRIHVLRKDGFPVRLTDYSYTVKITDEDGNVADQLDLLKSMQGEFLYLVDSVHPNNGSNHAPYVKRVILEKVGEIANQDPLLRFFYVEIYLSDAQLLED